jgi:hypothetical protein
MDPQDLIAAAYATNISEGEGEAVFVKLVEAAELNYNDQDARFEMTSEDLACTYSL